MLTAAAVAVGVTLGLAAPASAADGTVSGTVFRDFDADGVLDVGSNDPATMHDRGMAGVTVTARDAHGAVVGTTTSGVDGTYTLPVTGAFTDQVRVQFTGLPTGMYPSFSVLGAAAGQSGSNVHVATLGDTGVDFGVSALGDYNKADEDTPLAIPLHYAGQRQYQVNPSQPQTGVSLAAYPWQDQWTTAGAAPDFNFVNDGTQPSPFFGLPRGRTILAHFDETGGLWGTAAEPSTGDLFTAAVLKRQVDLGPLGLAGVYRVPGAYDPASGTISSTPGALQDWLNLGPDLAADPANGVPNDVPGLGIDFGTFDATYSGRGGFIRPQDPAADAQAFEDIGTVGIGGIAISGDNTALYVMNLHLREIEVVDIASKTLRTTIPLGLASDDRPWALAVQHGQILVGYIEGATASSTAGMHAVVRAVPEADATDLASSSSQVLRVPLDYQKGPAFSPGSATCSQAGFEQSCLWHPWTNTFDPAAMMTNNNPGQLAWPQPMLTDLAFSSDGDLVLGFADRFGFQMGYQNIAPDAPAGTSTPTYEAFSSGDTLIAAPTASGTYAIENDGVVGSKSSASTQPDQGPGGREFFYDSNVFAGTRGNEHQEITTGGLATLPGANQIASTGFDTISEFRTNGFAWYNTTGDAGVAGTAQRGRMVMMPIEGALSKAGGLGDVAAMLVEAPIQIGNVAWFDADQDGVQDPDEPPIPGLTVQLLDDDGTIIGTTTTDANGQYYFSSAGTPGGTPGFLPRGGDYTVRFVKPTTGDLFSGDPTFGTVAWSDVRFTTTAAGNDRAVDSDAVPNGAGTQGDVAYTAGAPGQNDPDLDAGFVADASLVVTKQVGDDSLPIPDGTTFTIDLDARDFRGDTETLTPSSVTLAPGDSQTITGIPVGTQVRATEADDPNYDVTVSPAGYFLVGSTSPTTTVTVTNTRLASTGFSITKTLDAPDGSVPDDVVYTGTWTCTFDGETDGSGTWSVHAGETTTITSDDLWIGSECVVTEDAPDPVDGGEWGPTPDPITVTLGEAGADPVPVADVTNTFTPDVPPSPTPTPSPSTPAPSPSPSPTPSTPPLATTGSDARTPALAVLTFLLGGGALLALATRRRRRD